MRMNTRYSTAILTMALGVGVVAIPAIAETTAGFSAASDYVFRGFSRTDENAAVQAYIDHQTKNGFYAGGRGSNVDFYDPSEGTNMDVELDAYLGIRGAFNEDWRWDTHLTRYMFSQLGKLSNDNDYNELSAGLSFKDRISANVAYSDDVFHSGGAGYYYALTSDFPLPLPYQLSVHAGVGYSDLTDALGFGYYDWQLGVAKKLRSMTFGLTYYDTDAGGVSLFGDQAGEKAVLSFSKALRFGSSQKGSGAAGGSGAAAF